MQTTSPILRECLECGQVWLDGEPNGRQPPSCPHGCDASVVTLTPEGREETVFE